MYPRAVDINITDIFRYTYGNGQFDDIFINNTI